MAKDPLARLDEDISVEGLLAGRRSAESASSLAKWRQGSRSGVWSGTPCLTAAGPGGGSHGVAAAANDHLMNERFNPMPRTETHAAAQSIGDYLIARLMECGVRDVFGIPGDYVLAFYAKLAESKLRLVGCTREDCAGFAADAYARVNGIGAVCVTYCVGGLNLCNPVAGAYAEKSPVVVISGAPGLRERVNNPLLHHRVKDFRTQFDVFRRLTVASTDLTDPSTAFREIDRVLDAVMRYKRPGYIELPRDMVGVVPGTSYPATLPRPTSDADALAEAVAEASRRIEAARRPVIIADVEIHRFGLQEQLLALAEGAGIPITTTILGKSVISERHPLFAGLYEGAMGHDEVTRFVEESDLVLLLGAFMTDLNLGIFTANLDPGKCIYATSETLRISHHHFHGVLLARFRPRAGGGGTEGPGPAAPGAAPPGRAPSCSPPRPRSPSAGSSPGSTSSSTRRWWSSPRRATPCSPRPTW